MRTLFSGFCLFAAVLTAAPHPSQCVTVTVKKVDSAHWEEHTVNACNTAFPEVAVLVKFFNDDWERIGVSGFVMNYVAPYERGRKIFEVPADVGKFSHVGVRAITDHAADALR